jgi:hypothetical protein
MLMQLVIRRDVGLIPGMSAAYIACLNSAGKEIWRSGDLFGNEVEDEAAKLSRSLSDAVVKDQRARQDLGGR